MVNKKNPYIGILKSSRHDYVEIAGIKWATCNIGSDEPWEPGLYFAFGETVGYAADQVGRGEGKKYFGWVDYKYGNGAPLEYNMEKYNRTDDKMVLDLEDDAAHVNWGGNWRMPNPNEFRDLVMSTTKTWVENYKGTGISGKIFTDNNDESKQLFFPATGYCLNGEIVRVNDSGHYCSNMLYDRNVRGAYYLYFKSTYQSYQGAYYRWFGYSVRPVLDC